MSILDLLDGVIRKPASTFKVIAKEKPVGWAMLIFAVSSLFGLISTDFSVLEPFQISPTPFVALQIILSVAGLFICAGFLHLLSRLFKGSGDYWGVFSALGLAQFPGFLTPLGAALGRVGGIAGSVLGGLISMVAGIWVLVLYVIALRESRRISTGASILTYLIAVFIVVVPVITCVVCLVLRQGIIS